MGSISFEHFPATARASATVIEMKGKKRSLKGNLVPQIVLIVGQYDQTNTSVVEHEPVQAFTLTDVADKFGYGSEIFRQAVWVFHHLGGFSENVWVVPVAEPDGPSAASGDTVFTGTATAAGTFYFSIGGELIRLTVPKGTTADEAGTALVAAIGAAVELPVTATSLTGTVTMTSKWQGATANQITIVANPGGDVQSANAPEGLTVTVPGALSGGAGDPDVESVFRDGDGADILGDRWYTVITAPYSDSTALGHYASIGDDRHNPPVNRRFAAYVGYTTETYAQAYAVPATINSPWICPVWDDRVLSPAFEFAAAISGLVAASATIDPGRPFKTLPVGVPVENGANNRLYAEDDALFRAGMGYCRVNKAGHLVVGDLATSYRTNAGGAATEEWFDALAIHRRQQLAFDVETAISSEPYIRSILGSDDVVTAKDYVVKPKTLVTTLINLVDAWASQGWVKNPEAIKETIVTEINESYNSRLDGALTLDEAQALRIVAIKASFLY